MVRCRYFIDFEKEEKWLAGMAAQGYGLTKAWRFFYVFESAPPEQAVIRVDYRYFPWFTWDDDFAAYCTLFEDNGWEHIAGQKRSGFQYYKRKNGCDDEHIFSDADSRAERYNRLALYASPTNFIAFYMTFYIISSHTDWANTVPAKILVGVIGGLLLIFDTARSIKIQRLRKKTFNEHS